MVLVPLLHVDHPLAFAPEVSWRTCVAPVRATCGGGAAALVAGVLAALGTQGSWELGKQEIQCSKRI